MRKLTIFIFLIGLNLQLIAGGLVSHKTDFSQDLPYYGHSFLKKRWGPDIVLGGSIGVNFSNVKGADAVDTKIAINSSIGLITRLQYDGSTALQTGIFYARKGYKKKSDTKNGNEIYHEDFRIHLNYIEVPILLSFSFHEPFIITIDLGSYMGLLTSAQKTGSLIRQINEEFDDPTNINDDYKEFHKSFDFGLQIGGGIQYPLTHKRKGTNVSVFAKTMMQIGLRSVSSNKEFDFNNRTYQVCVGVLFHLDQ